MEPGPLGDLIASCRATTVKAARRPLHRGRTRPRSIGRGDSRTGGRLIQEAYGDTTLSGIGICSDKAPRAILSTESGDLVVQGGFYARVALTQVVVLRFQGGDLRPAPVTFLVDRLGPRRE